MENFGKKLQALRKKSGITQEELADLIGVHCVTVSQWENNTFTPKTEKLKKIATALHVSESDLLSDTDGESSGWVLTVKIAPNFREEVIDMSKGIPKKSSIITDNEGGFLMLGGAYELWQDDNNFKKFIQDIKKLRGTVIQNGIALGAIKA